jgi:hypothetical protein
VLFQSCEEERRSDSTNSEQNREHRCVRYLDYGKDSEENAESRSNESSLDVKVAADVIFVFHYTEEAGGDIRTVRHWRKNTAGAIPANRSNANGGSLFLGGRMRRVSSIL